MSGDFGHDGVIGRWLWAWRRPAAPSLLASLCRAGDPMAALLLNDAAGPCLVIDAQGRVCRANAALGQMLAGAVSLASGSSAEILFHPTLRDIAWNDILAVLRKPMPQPRSFTSMLAVGEAGQAIRVTVMPLCDAAEVSGAVLRFTDITTQRDLEAQLAHSQKLQATGQLAGGIAHDFNNLLTAVLGAAEEIIDREQPGETPSETREDALQIRASAQRGAALVRQLLAFGRQQTLQPRTLAVNEVIEEISSLLRRLLGSKIRLTLVLEQPGRLVRVDPTQLDQVLVNLAVNARDAMPAGGELTLRSGHVTLFRPLTHGAETIPPGRYVMIEVHDTGRGIPPEILPRIFDPFFTTKRELGGSGLGLSTVHGIVRQSDGFLGVDSVLGKGTSVRLYLPRWDVADGVAIPHAPPLAAPDEPRPKAESRGVVLLVDDEDAVRRLAARALERGGWQVLSADSGEAALDLLRQLPPDSAGLAALVSDMVMPGIDGSALAEAVRQHQSRPSLPVILVSGYAQSPLRGGLQVAHTVFLAKPYRLAELVTTLQRLVQADA